MIFRCYLRQNYLDIKYSVNNIKMLNKFPCSFGYFFVLLGYFFVLLGYFFVLLGYFFVLLGYLFF